MSQKGRGRCEKDECGGDSMDGKSGKAGGGKGRKGEKGQVVKQ
jgi:hypothetical protein